MGTIIIQEETTKNPIQLMGIEAGVCWGADINDVEKNFNRGIDCMESGHHRVAEYPQVYLVIDGYSARVIRELYTHIGGSPTRLQASTRYIDYDSFVFIDIPVLTPIQKMQYEYAMESIRNNYAKLLELGVSKENAANILPLGMETKVVLRTNLRNLMDMSRNRMCTRAYWEFRQMFNDIIKALREYSVEWSILIDKYFKPKCEILGYCPEKKSCGRINNKGLENN